MGCWEQVLFDLTPREMEIFDGNLQSLPMCCLLPHMPNRCSIRSSFMALSCPPEFEGDEYYKADTRPLLEDGGALETSIYVWQESARYATWRTMHLTPSRTCLAITTISKALPALMSMAGCLLASSARICNLSKTWHANKPRSEMRLGVQEAVWQH